MRLRWRNGYHARNQKSSERETWCDPAPLNVDP